MSRKYIKLFEELGMSPTWSTVRDTIQNRKPFLIVICKDSDSCLKCKEYLSPYSSVDQTAYFSENGENLEFPSLFVSIDNKTNFESTVKTLFNKFSIKRLVVGTSESEFSVMYYDPMTGKNLGNELVSDLSPESMPPDDYFKIDSTYYKFINFNV